MRNYWLDRIHLKETVKLLTILLNDEFKGKTPQPKEWQILIQDLVDVLYCNDIIVQNGLINYKIVCNIGNYGLIDKLELVEK